MGRVHRIATQSVVTGTLDGGIPMIRFGSGPPLLLLSGLTPEHRNPTGLDRRMQLRSATAFAEHFTVYLVNRRPGLPAGITMTDLAADVAAAIQRDLDSSPMIHGASTGGLIALQLALDHPRLVNRVVIAAAACRSGTYRRSHPRRGRRSRRVLQPGPGPRNSRCDP